MATYSGTGITTGGWTAGNGENDRTCDQDENAVRLEGETGENEAFGNHAGDRVANLNVTHVSRPAKTRSLPADHKTNQNALSRGRSRGMDHSRGY